MTDNASADDSGSPDRSGSPPVSVAAQPVAWLSLAVAGLVLFCIGVGIEAYRHQHGAGTAELISRSSPGLLVALAGGVMAAVGVLMALTLLLFREVDTVDAAVRRGIAVIAAWTVVACVAAVALTYAVVTAPTIGHGGHESASVAAPGTAAPGAAGRVTLHGSLTVDGRPLVAEFLGARVIRDGLLAACQRSIPAVSAGRYQIGVLSEAEVSGCGAPGGRVVLWTNVDGQTLFSRGSTPWPVDSGTATFDAEFSTADPEGAGQAATEFFARVTRNGVPVPVGTAVRAFIGGTLCSASSIRNFDGDIGAIVIVVGPQLAGCAKDGRITFDIGGKPAAETATNDLGSGGDEHDLELSIP